jgi:hypothetical protein
MANEGVTPIMEINVPGGQLVNLPVMSRERFSELTGYPIGVINNWIAKGYLPTFEIGRYSAINLEVLRQMCLEKGFRL